MIKITREDLEAFFKVNNIIIRKDIENKAPTTYDELNAIISEDTDAMMSIVIEKFDTDNKKVTVPSTTTSTNNTSSSVIPSNDVTVSSKDQIVLDEINAAVAKLEAKANSGATIK